MMIRNGDLLISGGRREREGSGSVSRQQHKFWNLSYFPLSDGGSTHCPYPERVDKVGSKMGKKIGRRKGWSTLSSVKGDRA